MEEGAGLPYGILAQIENLHKVAGKSIQKRLGKYLKTPLEEFYRPVSEKGRVAEAAAEYALLCSIREKNGPMLTSF